MHSGFAPEQAIEPTIVINMAASGKLTSGPGGPKTVYVAFICVLTTSSSCYRLLQPLYEPLRRLPQLPLRREASCLERRLSCCWPLRKDKRKVFKSWFRKPKLMSMHGTRFVPFILAIGLWRLRFCPSCCCVLLSVDLLLSSVSCLFCFSFGLVGCHRLVKMPPSWPPTRGIWTHCGCW